MIRLAGLTVAYGYTPVLEDVAITFRNGAMTGLIGANGAGKSTLIKAAVGLLPAPGAQIDIDGTVGYMPQHADIDWDFPATLIDVALMGRTPHLRWWQWPSRNDKQIADHMLERVGLADKRNDPISALSGGQRQRTLLARTLACEPDILILDEPFAGVDQQSQATITTILRELRDQGTTIILVHHDLAEVAELCDDVVLVANRKILAAGPTETTLTESAISELFSLP